MVIMQVAVNNTGMKTAENVVFWNRNVATALKKTQAIQGLKRHFCPPNLKMHGKPMKCGHLSTKGRTNVGYGQ